MRFKRFLVAAVACLISHASVNAGLITSVTSSNNAIATVNVTQLATIANSRTLKMTVDLFQRNVPFDLIFSAPAGAPVNNTYNIEMTIVNNIVGGANGYINGFDLTNLPGQVTPGWSGLLVAQTPTSPDLTFQAINGPNNYNIPGGWRFGGINGGGKALYNGGSATVFFRYQQKTPVAGGTGTTRLRFTANPEPATMLLAGLALCPAVVVARRRRNNQTVA